MPPDPAQPITQLPERAAADGYALVAAMAPGLLALLFTVMAIFMLTKIVKGM